MGFKEGLMNVLSFGASGKIEKAQAQYQTTANKLTQKMEKQEKLRENVNLLFEELIMVKKKAILEVKKIQKITKSLSVKDRVLLEDNLASDNHYSIKQIDESIGLGEQAINATKGVATGVSTALGAWALAGTIGTASTGTAIASLSGVAATKATLAWLGGGSLAAGGGGMAAGTALLGGLVAVPALAVMGLFSHLSANKKIKEIKKEENKLLEYIEAVEKNILALSTMKKRANELIKSISKAVEGFQVAYKISCNVIYPIKNQENFSDKQLAEIQSLMNITSSVLQLVDTKIV
ncbi:MAG: hypothetical protein P1P64_04760 [Treponemataceae bacterium]